MYLQNLCLVNERRRSSLGTTRVLLFLQMTSLSYGFDFWNLKLTRIRDPVPQDWTGWENGWMKLTFNVLLIELLPSESL